MRSFFSMFLSVVLATFITIFFMVVSFEWFGDDNSLSVFLASLAYGATSMIAFLLFYQLFSGGPAQSVWRNVGMLFFPSVYLVSLILEKKESLVVLFFGALIGSLLIGVAYLAKVKR